VEQQRYRRLKQLKLFFMTFVIKHVRPQTSKKILHFFSQNVTNQVKNQIRSIFPVSNLVSNTMHLGHPMIFSHKDRNRAYNFIYSKFHAKFASIKANKLNHAGRLQYIKSVLSSIPVYYMSTILFSKSFIAKINAIIRNFWWAGIQDENPTNPIAFRSWDICKPKNQGGLGIRDMELINKSLIIPTAWNVITKKNPILSNAIKAKYYQTLPFGLVLPLDLGLFFGLLFCR
jgi:hypothetical protein